MSKPEMTSDYIRNLLAQKFQKESARLKSWGTKTDEKAAISFADCVTEFVRALRSEARYRELKKIKRFLEKHSKCDPRNELGPYLKERLRVVKLMQKAIERFAIQKEEKRIWQYSSLRKKEKKHKHRSNHGGNFE